MEVIRPYLVQMSKKLQYIHEIRKFKFFGPRLFLPRKKCETRLLGKLYVLHFVSTIYVRETPPDRATVSPLAGWAFPRFKHGESLFLLSFGDIKLCLWVFCGMVSRS